MAREGAGGRPVTSRACRRPRRRATTLPAALLDGCSSGRSAEPSAWLRDRCAARRSSASPSAGFPPPATRPGGTPAWPASPAPRSSAAEAGRGRPPRAGRDARRPPSHRGGRGGVRGRPLRPSALPARPAEGVVGGEPARRASLRAGLAVEPHLGRLAGRDAAPVRRPQHRLHRGRRRGVVRPGRRSRATHPPALPLHEPAGARWPASRGSWSWPARAAKATARRELRRSADARPTSPTPSPRSWSRRAPRSITTSCSARAEQAFHVATLGRGLAARTAASTTCRSRSGRPSSRHDIDVTLAARGRRVHPRRPLLRRRRPPHRHPHPRRPRAAPRDEPAALQGHPGRAGRGACSRPGARAQGRPEDRRRTRPTRTCCSRGRRWCTAPRSSRSWPTT